MKRVLDAQMNSRLKIHLLLVGMALFATAAPVFALTRIGNAKTFQAGASCCTCNRPDRQTQTQAKASPGTVLSFRGCPMLHPTGKPAAEIASSVTRDWLGREDKPKRTSA